MKPRVLVVDDNRDLARGVAMILGELALEVAVVHSAEEALERLAAGAWVPDVVFSDVRMPGLDGLSLLKELRTRVPHARVILFTAYGTIEAAVEAMKAGAFHYLTKPFNEDELLLVAERAWKDVEAEAEITRLRNELAREQDFHGLHHRDRRMVPVVEAIRKAAPTPATVLVCGESGTGKELVARAVHAASTRASGPFVAFNAAALTETLAESELFGSRKGAFTGADRDRKGLFVEAQGGTLFIDEVQAMPAALQAKLLRALQEREVLPVGASTPVRVDARIIGATNRDPQKLLADGTLRKDLYYRLAVVRIVVPPLRERLEDIPLLCQLFLERLAAQQGTPPRRLGARALRLLVSHDWPGNVRELQNVMERAAVMCESDDIGPRDIQFEDDDLEWQPDTESGVSYEEAKRVVLERFQRRYVERLMADAKGNISAAARKADITRAALHRILKRLGIDARDDGDTADG